jgi:uncharacterized protein (DUF1330 family)
MPKAYVINEIHVSDAAMYKQYADQALATVEAFGGRYLIRGGNAESLDGSPVEVRIVVLEFPDRETARAWRDSDAYQTILKIREASSTSRVWIVDGLEP